MLRIFSATLLAYLLVNNLVVCKERIAHCGNRNPPEKTIKFTYASTLLKDCATASVVQLPDYMVLVATARTAGFLKWIKMDYKLLKMCLSVENLEVTTMSFSAAVKGECLGPDLSFVNNYNLRKIYFTEQSLISLISLRAMVRIRGNRHLTEEFLNDMKGRNPTWDIQDVGECYIPTPFSSFDTLVNCTSVFGVLTVDERVQTIEEMPSSWKKFAYTGCLHVSHTELIDISFLMAFSRYTATPECNSYIFENKKLCPEELDFVKDMFPGTLIRHNGAECDLCRGGKLSEALLNRVMDCLAINGNLVISNLTGLPPNINNLNHIIAINGTLIIENNRGLHNFNYFTSLERVGLGNDKKGLAIIVKHNPDLTSLSLPRLIGIVIEKHDPRVVLDNNPLLFKTSTAQQRLYKEGDASFDQKDKIPMLPASDVSGHDEQEVPESPNSDGYLLLTIFGISLLILLFVTFVLIVFFIVRRRKKRKNDENKRSHAQ